MYNWYFLNIYIYMNLQKVKNLYFLLKMLIHIYKLLFLVQITIFHINKKQLQTHIFYSFLNKNICYFQYKFRYIYKKLFE